MKVTATAVPEADRLKFMPDVFGPKIMMHAEALLYHYARCFAPDDYSGGMWEFYKLSNGSGYAAPTTPERYNLSVSGNGFEGSMSADAAGIVFTLFAMNSMCFELHGKDEALGELMAERWHALREFAAQHAEARSIFRAID
ncbi:antirestriction protein [Burkholderia vietnamiensis]|uniref:antirestriction protein n=1 Tax=Burkholderia vietnamiensis TaxID=60552 RepID=UPI00158E775B|nr:antirestriction protein [Burkholderia vietnamiensis]